MCNVTHQHCCCEHLVGPSDSACCDCYSLVSDIHYIVVVP
jgi:hypothetical protein